MIIAGCIVTQVITCWGERGRTLVEIRIVQNASLTSVPVPGTGGIGIQNVGSETLEGLRATVRLHSYYGSARDPSLQLNCSEYRLFSRIS
jgi:hypothetical protein